MSAGDYTAAVARAYDDDPEHALFPDEANWWCAQLANAGLSPPASVLDLGAGTGLLMRALQQAGYEMHGLEPSPDMIAQALARDPALTRSHFTQATADQQAAIETARFDAVVSRQMLCHIEAPDAVFRAVHNWLRPNGIVLFVDGQWPGEAWDAQALTRQPYASLTTTDALQRDLERCGFGIVTAGPATRLNAIRQQAVPESVSGSVPRYAVHAKRLSDARRG